MDIGTLPLREWTEAAVVWATAHGAPLFAVVTGSVDGIDTFLRAALRVPPPALAVLGLGPAAAARLGLRDRGRIVEGWAADLVVFDPGTVIDTATYERPAQYAAGIRHVIVNGRAAILDGVETGERPGRLLRRGA